MEFRHRLVIDDNTKLDITTVTITTNANERLKKLVIIAKEDSDKGVRVTKSKIIDKAIDELVKNYVIKEV